MPVFKAKQFERLDNVVESDLNDDHFDIVFAKNSL